MKGEIMEKVINAEDMESLIIASEQAKAKIEA